MTVARDEVKEEEVAVVPGEMSAKLKEQLKRLTEKAEPVYNDFGDIGDISLLHQTDLTTLADMVQTQKLDYTKIRVLTISNVVVEDLYLDSVVKLVSTVPSIVIKSMEAEEGHWEAMGEGLQESRTVGLVRLVACPAATLVHAFPALAMVPRLDLTKLDIPASTWHMLRTVLEAEDSKVEELLLTDIAVTEDNMEDITGCLARVSKVQLTNVELGRGPRFWDLLREQEARATWIKLSLMTVYEDQIKHMAAFLVRVEEVSTT